MVVRVSATLPNGVVLAVEGDAPLPRETLEFVLIEATSRLQSAVASSTPQRVPEQPPRPPQRQSQPNIPNAPPAAGRSRGDVPPAASSPTPASGQAPVLPTGALQATNASTPSQLQGAPSAGHGQPGGREALARYCLARDPRNAMRRVVTIIEGSAVTEGLPSVAVDALPDLFRSVGWPVPENVSQVVRNAARAQYGWLQRDPFRPGHYLVTDKGRSAVLPAQ